MINRLRQYLTPIIITLGVAVFGATAFAVVPDLVSNLQKDGPAASASETAKSPVEDAAGKDAQDQVEPSESPDPSESPEAAEADADKAEATPTPGVNHGNCVSYAARTASADAALKGRMKGEVISSVARSGAVSGPTTGGAAPSDACARQG